MEVGKISDFLQTSQEQYKTDTYTDETRHATSLDNIKKACWNSVPFYHLVHKWASTHTQTHTTILRLCGICPGQPGWASTRRNIHPLIVVINHPYLLSPSTTIHGIIHPHVLQSFSTISLQVFFGLPLGLVPTTSYSIHFFTQSLSSFRSTWPYHCNLFCCSTEIMSSNSSLPLNSLLGPNSIL